MMASGAVADDDTYVGKAWMVSTRPTGVPSCTVPVKQSGHDIFSPPRTDGRNARHDADVIRILQGRVATCPITPSPRNHFFRVLMSFFACLGCNTECQHAHSTVAVCWSTSPASNCVKGLFEAMPGPVPKTNHAWKITKPVGSSKAPSLASMGPRGSAVVDLCTSRILFTDMKGCSFASRRSDAL